MPRFRTYIFLALLICLYLKVESQTQFDRVFKDNIRTVQFYNSSVQNSYPMMQLGAESVRLQFDDVTGKARDYQYSVMQCDAEWQPTQLFRTDYLTGLAQDYLNTFQQSISTYKNYVHYSLEFPNQNMGIKLSGNYILKVFEANDPSKVIISRRFYVYENIVSISGTVSRPNFPRYAGTHQQVALSIDIEQARTNDPYRSLRLLIRQNWRTDNEVRDLKPRIIEGNNLIYNYDEEMLFEGGNEFHPIDLHDVRMRGYGVRYFTLDSNYSATLFEDDDRSGQVYTKWIDQNGQFTVNVSNRDNPGNEADYIWTFFHLKVPQKEDQDVYVYGALSNWQLDSRYKLTYSGRDGEYQAAIPLKQGYYDFTYATFNKTTKAFTLSTFDGNHWETDNNYTVLMYMRPIGQNYDVIVGKATFNSQQTK